MGIDMIFCMEIGSGIVTGQRYKRGCFFPFLLNAAQSQQIKTNIVQKFASYCLFVRLKATI